MGRLRILTRDGDRTVVWDKERVGNGDPEAQAAVREAERIFRKQLEQGATAFRLKDGTPPEKVHDLDLDAELIVMVPRVTGGGASA